MPAVPPPAKVLVTGANGFLAVHVVRALLARGYVVRGTVRSASKGEYIANLFRNEFPGKFEYVVVRDISEPGAFNEAVSGVEAVAHTASPVVLNDPNIPVESFIRPAVAGTVEVLKSIQSHGSSVKRVVVTSSVAALLDPSRDGTGYEYSEKDWNEYSVREAQNNPDAESWHKYRASKALAERALWDFMEAEKPGFGAVTVNPPFIYGPILHECDSIESLNFSTKLLWDRFAEGVPEDQLAAFSGNVIDVRDAAEVHVDAIELPQAGGHRLIIGIGPVSNQDFFDAAHAAGNLPPLPFSVPLGKPGISDTVRPKFVTLSSESARLIGREGKFIQLPQIVKDTLQSIVDRGLVAKSA